MSIKQIEDMKLEDKYNISSNMYMIYHDISQLLNTNENFDFKGRKADFEIYLLVNSILKVLKNEEKNFINNLFSKNNTNVKWKQKYTINNFVSLKEKVLNKFTYLLLV